MLLLLAHRRVFIALPKSKSSHTEVPSVIPAFRISAPCVSTQAFVSTDNRLSQTDHHVCSWCYLEGADEGLSLFFTPTLYVHKAIRTRPPENPVTVPPPCVSIWKVQTNSVAVSSPRGGLFGRYRQPLVLLLPPHPPTTSIAILRKLRTNYFYHCFSSVCIM